MIETGLPGGMLRRGTNFYVQFKDRTGRWRRKSVGSDLDRALRKHAELRAAGDALAPNIPLAVESYLKRQETFSKSTSIGVRALLLRSSRPTLRKQSDCGSPLL